MKKTVFIAVTFFLLSSIPCLPQDRTSAEEIITPDPQGFRVYHGDRRYPTRKI